MENKDTSSPPAQPSLPWRMASAMTTGTIGSLCRGFLYGLNRVETIGLERFLNVLEERRDVDKRTRGLLTGKGY
jgi:monolysocardiolipin acyltransferase